MAKDSKPARRPSTRVEVLKNALQAVADTAHDWRRLVSEFYTPSLVARREPRERRYDRMEEAKANVRDAIETAHDAMAGVDELVRSVEGKNPAVWSSGLNAVLNAFKRDILGRGSFLPRDKHGETLQEHINQVVRQIAKLQDLYLADLDHGTLTADGSEGPPTGNEPPAELLGKEAAALALLVEHPDWTVTKIADAIGCHRGSLYRMTRFQQAREALKQGRGNLPTGSKDGETGTVEAWDDGDR